MIGRIATLVAVIAALVASPAVAAPSQNAIEKQLRCVTCGTSLDVSDAPSAVEMKERIAREISAGRSEDQIIDGFVRDYGRTVLSSPPKSGMDLWLAWALPIGIPLIGLLLLPLIIRGWRRSRGAVEAAPATELDAGDDALVRQEMEAFDER